MKVLLIGGHGYIGNGLSKVLIENQIEFTSTSKNSNLAIGLDLLNKNTTKEFLKKKEFNVIVNLAGRIPNAFQVRNFKNDKLDINRKGIQNLVEVLHDLNYHPYLIHIASATEPSISSQKAESEYSSSKFTGTDYFRKYLMRNEAEGVILYLHNVYSQSTPKDKFISRCIEKFRFNETLELFHPGRIRDFCLLEEVSLKLANILLNLETIRKMDLNEIEIGTGVGLSIREVAEIIASKLHASFSLIIDRDSGEFDPNPVRIARLLPEIDVKCETLFPIGIKKILEIL